MDKNKLLMYCYLRTSVLGWVDVETHLFTKGVLYDEGVVVNAVNHLSNMGTAGIEKCNFLPENSSQILPAQHRCLSFSSPCPAETL